VMHEDERSITQYIRDYAAVVEQRLSAVFDGLDIPPRLMEAMKYSLHAGGKRIRPVLAVAAAEAVGGRAEQAMGVACAVEMIHTYSLIHDDLPAMDNDDFRRGKPTNHKVFGEAMAILAGDALLTHAFFAVASSVPRVVLEPERVVRIIGEMALYAGPAGMVGGQAADMEGEQGRTTLDELKYIHTHKTGDLIVFSVRAGAIAAGASEAQLAALEQYARKLGHAFQIQDDVLDVTGDEGKLGKKAGVDEARKKVTYPYFLGVERSRELIRQLTEEARAAIGGGQIPHPRRLLELADYLLDRDH